MSKVCVPAFFIPFVYFYIHWHARFFFPAQRKSRANFLSKQTGTPGGTWFSSHLCCAVVVRFVFAILQPTQHDAWCPGTWSCPDEESPFCRRTVRYCQDSGVLPDSVRRLPTCGDPQESWRSCPHQADPVRRPPTCGDPRGRWKSRRHQGRSAAHTGDDR